MKNNNASTGMGFWSVLQIVFIVLKLCGIITWSWIWVLSPTWISAIITVFLVTISAVIWKRNRRKKL